MKGPLPLVIAFAAGCAAPPSTAYLDVSGIYTEFRLERREDAATLTARATFRDRGADGAALEVSLGDAVRIDGATPRVEPDGSYTASVPADRDLGFVFVREGLPYEKVLVAPEPLQPTVNRAATASGARSETFTVRWSPTADGQAAVAVTGSGACPGTVEVYRGEDVGYFALAGAALPARRAGETGPCVFHVQVARTQEAAIGHPFTRGALVRAASASVTVEVQ